jgi:hypothetical protein
MEDGVKQVDAVPEKADVAETEKDVGSPSPENAGVAEGLTKGADDCPELIPQGGDDSDDEAEGEEELDEDEESSDAKVQPEIRRSARIREGVAKPSRFAATTVKLRNKSQDHTGEIQEAKAAEIKQVFE